MKKTFKVIRCLKCKAIQVTQRANGIRCLICGKEGAGRIYFETTESRIATTVCKNLKAELGGVKYENMEKN